MPCREGLDTIARLLSPTPSQVRHLARGEREGRVGDSSPETQSSGPCPAGHCDASHGWRRISEHREGD